MFYPNHPFATDREFTFTGTTVHPPTGTKFDTYVHVGKSSKAYASVFGNNGPDYSYMDLELVNPEYHTQHALKHLSVWGSHIAYVRALAHLAKQDTNPPQPLYIVVVQYDGDTPNVHGPYRNLNYAKQFASELAKGPIELDETVTVDDITVTLTETYQN